MNENKMRVSTLLLATETGTQLKCCPSLSVGMTNSVFKSVSRPSSNGSASKVSTIALALDTLLTSTDAFGTAKLDDDAVYVEETGNARAVILKDLSVQSSETLAPVDLSTLMLIQALASNNNPEVTRLFGDAVKEFNVKGKVSEALIYELCDSFYHVNVKRGPITMTVNIDVQAATLEALARSSNPRQIPELKGTAAGKPKLINAKAAKEKKKEPESDLQQLLNEAKAGKYLVDYQWDPSQKEYIQSPRSLEGYIPNEEFRAILKKIKFRTDRVLARLSGLDLSKGQDRVTAIGRDYINLTLSGKPGTGKTKLAYMLAAATGLPIYTVSNSHNTDEDEYEGKTKMIDGKAVSVETDTLRCVEHGGILLLEEINLVNAAVAMGALGQLVEFPFLIKKFGYEPVRRHPLCVIITTMNTGTSGSKSMSQPFANRFKQSFVLNDPANEDFIRILMSSTGAGRDVCSWVYDCYERITACVEEDNGMADVESILLSLSMRSCAGAVENIQEGMKPKLAVTNSIIGKVAEQDREVAESCGKVLSSMREPDFELDEEE